MNELASATVAPQPVQQAGTQLAPAQAPQIPSPLAEVAQGAVPATLLPPVAPGADLDPAQSFVVDNFDKLGDLGLDAVEAPDQSTVVFNSSMLDRKTVEKAAAEGTLQQLLAPPAAAAPAANPAASEIAQVRASQRPAMPVQSAPMVGPKVPASTQTALANARVKSMPSAKPSTSAPPVTAGNQLAKRPV